MAWLNMGGSVDWLTYAWQIGLGSVGGGVAGRLRTVCGHGKLLAQPDVGQAEPMGCKSGCDGRKS
jgi:hypothetical protein